MTRKQIDASRERRLWITQVAMPIVGALFLIPETRKAIVDKTKEVTASIKEKIRKKKEEK